MTQALKDLWKKNFPAWPDALIEKFSDQIEIEANYLDSNYGTLQKNFYDDAISKVNRKFSIIINGISGSYQHGFLSLFDPQNPKFIMSNSWGPSKTIVYAEVAPLDEIGTELVNYRSLPVKLIQFTFDSKWDSRLFSDIALRFEIVSKAIGESYFYPDQFIQIKVSPINNVLTCLLLNPGKKYQQSDSIIALHENGVSLPGLDINNLYEFNSYLKSYQNYSEQIQAAADVAKKTAAADLQNYRGDLDSKLLAQKNALQNLTLQLMTQTQGQADSVRRDMQQLNLQAVGLKLQILGLMKK